MTANIPFIALLGENTMTPTIVVRGATRRACLIIAASVVAFYLIHVVGMYQDFHHELTIFNNVRLTDRRTDVMYRLGSPTHVLGPIERHDSGEWQTVFTVDGPVGDPNTKPSNTRLEDYNEWVYEKANGISRLTVEFDTAALVKSISWYCDSADSLGWGPVAGIRNGDSEEKILSLGNPSINSIEHTTKTIEFADIGLKFLLTKGKVYMVTLKRPTKSESTIFWRFLHTLP